MILAKRREKPLGRMALAVVLGVAVLLEDRLGHQRDDFAEVRMHQHSSQQLMVVRDGAIAMPPFQTVRAMDLLRREIPRTIEGEQVVAIEEGQRLESFAPLQLTEDVGEAGT